MVADRTLHTCRTCRFHLVRVCLGMRNLNHYCTSESEAALLWCDMNRPSRSLPVVGARDCPGWEAP